jgi:hypothetical protein
VAHIDLEERGVAVAPAVAVLLDPLGDRDPGRLVTAMPVLVKRTSG